jgi:TonB-dependent starch-binding outer membrane protein SusC
MVMLSNFMMAQRTVTGTVTDAESGEALIGATVTVVGTTRGASTDVSGNYRIEVPNGATQLRFAYTGYKETTLALGAGNTLNASLAPGALLEEVVVVGYGSVRKTDATGAVTSVTEKDFNNGLIVAPEQLIQGRAAGVAITTSSGQPGAGINIRIRGTSSVRAGNNPLFVVDGVPLSGDDATAGGLDVGFGRSASRNPLTFINPADIASIDVLKDASATAIYGSRGANGVVIITTKKGQSGTGALDYNYNLGISQISKKYDLLNASEFIKAYETFNGAAAAQALNGGANTDWQDQILRTAISHNHNLSYSGGNASGSYRISFAYNDQEGIVKNTGLQRYSGRFNADKKFINDKLRISTQATISNIKDLAAPFSDNAGFEGDLIGAALKANPTQAIRDRDGKFIQLSNTEPNPAAMLEYTKDFTNTLRALASVSAEYQITKSLSFRTVGGFDRSFSARKAAYSRDLNVTGISGLGRLALQNIEINNRLWENYFTYNKNLGTVNLNAVAGYSYQRFDYSTQAFEFSNFRTSDVDIMMNNFASANQSAGKGVVGRNSSNAIDELQSYFGRVNLSIKDKYNFTATVRADGSTKFGGDNKYGIFPAFAFKWRLIEESFCPDMFSDLGLRLGYGITGNQEIPHNRYTKRQRYGDWDLDNNANVTGGGLADVAFANPGLKWESTSQINVGLDFGFAKGRISGSLDFYNKTTNDLLIQVTAAQPAVSDFVWRNLDADVVNTGAELSLNLVAVDKADFRWNVLLNGAYNKNEVKNFSGLINTGEINGQGLTGAFAQRIAEGQPLFAFFLRDFAGYDDNGISVYNGGDFQQFVGSPLPTINAGLTNSFSYKNLDLSIFLNSQFGNDIYSNTANAFFTAGALSNGRNTTRDVVGNGEGRLNAPDVSTRFLEKGDFVRVQDVTLGYRVKTGKSAVSNLRFYVTAQNLAVFTKYSGQDPEVNTNKALNDVPSLGIDYTAYPRARTFLLGAAISF